MPKLGASYYWFRLSSSDGHLDAQVAKRQQESCVCTDVCMYLSMCLCPFLLFAAASSSYCPAATRVGSLEITCPRAGTLDRRGMRILHCTNGCPTSGLGLIRHTS